MTSYRQAGVDLIGAERHVAAIAPAVTATWNERVVGGFGGFAAGVTLPPGYRNPVLMLTTDGVGTKLELARRLSLWEGVGFDLVAMVIDDLAAAGARPVGLVDYLAVGSLRPDRDTAIVSSIAAACSSAGCPLLGGETAEHPGVMETDQVDLAAAALGVVEQGEELGPHRVEEGDVVIGLASPNLRSNGFSLVRRVLGDRDLEDAFPGEGAPIGEVLLRPSVIYAPAVAGAAASRTVKAAAHITGGGLPGNLSRVLPGGLGIELDRRSWEIPNVFEVIQEWGEIPDEEMESTFNLGIGFCLIVAAPDADSVCRATGHDARVVGRVVAGEGVR
ncbi:MAG TPA: phosphoribosylformylglycinamidine cyclo-ligase [Acidimicrobiia bacterium]|nr:phosphoribosylformylglycinamidine cyclo-ligase [Acidimicrobiia bacterium]